MTYRVAATPRSALVLTGMALLSSSTLDLSKVRDSSN
jgi:hypothetical protein